VPIKLTIDAIKTYTVVHIDQAANLSTTSMFTSATNSLQVGAFGRQQGYAMHQNMVHVYIIDQ
jgi:hypothetical protein